MGLISATLSAAGSTLADQWKEYFYVDAIPNDTIVIKAHKKVRGFGNHGSDNIISDGSVIAVADGQCMIIVEQGQVVDLCAEPGQYVYDSKTEPSIFTGSLGDGIRNVFAEIGRRITFGGGAGASQYVYFVNTKEITGLKYGTASPVPFRVVDERAGIDMDISVKAFGDYSIKVADPILFYTNVCANVRDEYKVEDIEPMLRTELLTALQPAFAKLSDAGVRYSQVPAHVAELADLLNTELSKKWKDLRGIEIVSIGMSSIKDDAEDEETIKQMQKDAAYTNPNLAAAAEVGAHTQAMRDAAKNANGAAMGFMGFNAAQNSANINVGDLYAKGQAQNTAAGTDTWTCPKCGAQASGNFCSKCGTKKPESDKWYCPNCGQENTVNFCSKCGTKKPE